MRIIFLKENILLIAFVVFLWMTISLLTDQYYSYSDLKSHKGFIVKIDSTVTKFIDKPFFKQKTKKLFIKLNSEDRFFTLLSTNSFGEVSSDLNIGDNIIIYTKPKKFGVFGMRKNSDIVHLVKGDKIIIDLSSYKKSIRDLFVMTLIPSIVFLIIYITRVRHRIYWDLEG